jgi:asparagine synthase (glutamine-hydrolysing)
MTGALSHRGPDDRGFYGNSRIGLGHARLSIIDLAGGAQPMPNASRSVWITFNGEIFNYLELRGELIAKGHRFSTQSDTEVILHLYEEEGERCVERLNGQWAFAIWDEPRRRLFLSRDRIGVRPLFYTQTTDSFLFASEIKALFTCPEVSRELDLEALDQIFTFWCTLPPRTAFKSIRQLPPGHSMLVEDGQLRLWPHWRLELNPERGCKEESEQKHADELLALLHDAVRIRLRSDVPVGAYLSGGLDSTLVTALTNKLAGNHLRSFSVAFDDPSLDESSYQQQASSFLGTEHSTVQCSSDDIARAFPEVIRHAEQPILRTAPAPMFLLSRLVRDSGFKVVLTGEGADEMLGGYDIFKEVKIRLFWMRNPQSRLRPQLLRRLYPYMESIQRQPASYLANFFQVGPQYQGPFFSHLPRWQLTAKAKAFFSDSTRAALGRYDAMAELESALPEAYRGWDPFLQAQFLESNYLLPGYILSSQGDRMAMAHSVEGRFPFLDHRVVEFASRLPVRMKMKVLDEKHLLKRCARGLIPAAVTQRRKQPYRAPDGECFLEAGACEYVDELLSPDCIRRNGVFDAEAVTKLRAKFRAGRAIGAKDNMALVGILSTQLLIQQFVDSGTPGRSLHADTGSRQTLCR